MEINYIDVQKELIPYKFRIQLYNRTFEFEIQYNAEHDYFTVNIYRNDELIVAGEKLLYGKPLFENILYLDIPRVLIVPFDLAENHDRITYDNFNKDVFLYLVRDYNEL